MGSRGKVVGGGNSGGGGGSRATYQGQQMSADEAQARYQQDLATWRAPNNGLLPGAVNMGPPIPPPVAPVMANRDALAQAVNYQTQSGLGTPNSPGGRFNTMPFGSHR